MFVLDRRCGALALLALAGLFLAAERSVAGVFGLPLDDAWIHAAFARSIVRGEGLSYGGSEGWVGGSTAPLWTWLVALVTWVVDDPVLAGRLLGISAGIFAVLATARLARAATGDPLVAGWTALLLALTARFVWGTVSGMEVPLYVGLVSLGLALHLERRDRPLTSWIAAPVVLALAGWARPECFVFVLVAALHRRRLADLLAAALLLVPYPVYHLLVHGHPLPTTFYVKAAGRSALALIGTDPVRAVAAVASSTGMEVAAFLVYLPTHLPLVLAGLLPGIRRGVAAQNGVPFLAAALLCFVLAKGCLAYDAPWMQYGRYFAHTWPLFLILCLHGLDLTRAQALLPSLTLLAVVAVWFAFPQLTPLFFFDRGAPGGDLPGLVRWLALAPGTIFLCVALAGLASGSGRLPPRPPVWALALYLVPALVYGAEHHAHNVLDTEAMNVRMAREVERLVPPGEVVACHDVGALGYFGERPLLDLAGIVSPRVAFGGKDAALVLEEVRPRYLCVLDGWLGKLFPGSRAPAGIVEHRIVFRISWPPNITLGGGEYYLIELTWR